VENGEGNRSLPKESYMSRLSLADAPTLDLVEESKIYKLLAGSTEDDTIDASGICVMNGNYYATFEDTAHIARFGPSLSADDPANALYRQPDDDIGREDITYDATLGRFLVITEAVRAGNGAFKPKVTAYDRQLRFVEESQLDFPLEGKHKGMEGLASVIRQGQPYLLGLCEGNHCQGGRRGRRPGGGRIQVFQRARGYWAHVDTIVLPETLPFENYSSVTLRDNKLAVLSRNASAVWLGELSTDQWDIVGQGTIYRFPVTKKGKIAYCAVDGICWLSDNSFVAISDRSRSTFGFQRRCRKKDQSVHVFRFPDVD
jgi:hypothetical protein